MPQDVVILHGPVQSGKTTRLAAWCAGRRSVAGMLQPNGPHGREYHDIASASARPLEHGAPGEAMVAVGRFQFRLAAFAWANARLTAAAGADAAHTLIVDEIGPLELRGEGLADGLAAVLARTDGRAVLVVRDALVTAVRDGFGLAQAAIVPADSWPQFEQAAIGAP